MSSRFSASFIPALTSAACCSSATCCDPDSTRSGPSAAFTGPTSMTVVAPTSPVSAAVRPKPSAARRKRRGIALIGETRHPVGQLDFAHADFPRGNGRGGFGSRRFGRRRTFRYRKQRLPVQHALDVARRRELAADQAHARHVDPSLRQIEVRIVDARLGELQHRFPAATRRQHQVLHNEIGAVDLQPGHILAGLVQHHGKAVAQPCSEGAGRQFEIARALDHPQQIGQPHPLQPDFAARGDGIQPDITLPFERAALLRQLGRDQIVAAILGQGRQAVELDAERFQHGSERLARAVGVDVGDVAPVDLDVIDQHPRDGVGRRLLVFIQLGDQCGPVELAATPDFKRWRAADRAGYPGCARPSGTARWCRG